MSVNTISPKLARVIEQARSAQWKHLSLQGQGIDDEGAHALATLTDLTYLDLSGNRIGDGGARALSGLTKLTHLVLDRNRIGDEGARALTALAGLTSLNLDGNRIGDAGAHALATLTGLTSLHLSVNAIGNAGARALASLTSLAFLALRGNPIGDAGVRALLDSWEENYHRIRYLSLPRLTYSNLPPELLATTDAQALLAAYRRFRSSTPKTALDEAKLLIVGNEAVGKTSLVRYLVDEEPRDRDEQKTSGIATRHKIETRSWSPSKKGGPKLNIWDFGGQEIMHGTHQFFLTERSLYLIVLDDRYEDDTSVYHWLRIIANRGGTSPVIVVINKCDEGQQHLNLNITRLHREFPDIVVDVLRTSCIEGPHARGTIDALRAQIVETLNHHPRLDHVRDPIPVSWKRVKDAVSDRASLDKILRVSDFEALCLTAPPSDEPLTDPNERRALLRLLHDLGTVVAHGLQRDDPAALREITLLDPNWLTQAIYTILNNTQTKSHEGEFSRADMGSILDPEFYPPDRHEFILEMMEHQDIGLCFEVPGTHRKQFLIPELLSENEPEDAVRTWPEDSLCFRYTYEFLPRSFVPRFIVATHPMLAEPSTRWQTGVVLATAGCRVLLMADRAKMRIDIKVDGPSGLQRSALNVALAELERVHAKNPEMRPTGEVPLRDQPTEYESYEHLLKLEKLYGRHHEYLPFRADREYTVEELLEGVGRDLPIGSPTNRRTEITLPRRSALPISAPPNDDLLSLQRDYTGAWGATVFLFALLTLVPFFVGFKSLHLDFSIAACVYLIYHFLRFIIWMNVWQLTNRPALYPPKQQEQHVPRLKAYNKYAHGLGFFVILLLALTFATKFKLVFGTSTFQIPHSAIICDILGVPLPATP